MIIVLHSFSFPFSAIAMVKFVSLDRDSDSQLHDGVDSGCKSLFTIQPGSRDMDEYRHPNS
jgi:hypothetical protein